jgi:hypothetical protein
MNKLGQIGLFSLFICLLAASASALDTECDGVTPQQLLDLSEGSGAICFPVSDSNGVAIPDVKILSCSVVFTNSDGEEIGREELTGAPGTFHSYNVPRDGVGNGAASCTLDGLVSETSNVQIIFPSDMAPGQPILLKP